MDSFLQVAKLLFKEQVSNPQEHQCWQIHINIIHLLQQDSFNTNLNKLKKLTKRWKHLMVKFYSSIAKQQPTMNSKRTQSKKQSQMAKTAASNTTTSGEKLFSFKFPNFKVAQHWSKLIHFLSPPWVQDTCL